MNPYLRSLLGGQVAGSMIGPDFLDDMERRDATGAIVGNEIVVPGVDRPRPAPEPPVETATVKPSPMQVNLQQQDVRDDFIMGNAKPVSMAREAEKDTALNSDRRGLFGVKGTLRDILGIVSDAFLVQSGNQPLYMPRKLEESWSDAMAGFSESPEAERMAIERAMRVDGRRTQEFLQQSRLNQTNMGNLSLRGEELGRDKTNDLRKQLTGLAAAAVNGTPEQKAEALRIIQQNTANLPEDDVLRSGNLELIAGSGATPNQMLTLPLTERRVEDAEERTKIAWKQLGVAMRNAKSREEAVRIAGEALGQKVSAREFDEMIELFKLPFEIENEVSSTGRNNRANRNEGRSGRDDNRSWTIRPAGK